MTFVGTRTAAAHTHTHLALVLFFSKPAPRPADFRYFLIPHGPVSSVESVGSTLAYQQCEEATVRIAYYFNFASRSTEDTADPKTFGNGMFVSVGPPEFRGPIFYYNNSQQPNKCLAYGNRTQRSSSCNALPVGNNKRQMKVKRLYHKKKARKKIMPKSSAR